MKLIATIPIVLVTSMLGYCLYLCSGERLTEERIDDYKNQCSPIIQWLEERFESKGQYPKELPDEYMSVLDGFRPPSSYATWDNGMVYCIKIGDYSDRFTFVLYYTGTNWVVDA